MRPEVVEALQQAEQERIRTEQWLKEQGLWPIQSSQLDETASGDYSFLLTDEQYNNRQRVEWSLDRLRACLLQQNKYMGARDVYANSPTALTIEWGDFAAEIEIEISVYGRLAAVFVQGERPMGVLSLVDKCLAAGNFLRLTDDEIDELQQQGLHYQIF